MESISELTQCQNPDEQHHYLQFHPMNFHICKRTSAISSRGYPKTMKICQCINITTTGTFKNKIINSMGSITTNIITTTTVYVHMSFLLNEAFVVHDFGHTP
jgi:hypothetical protein